MATSMSGESVKMGEIDDSARGLEIATMMNQPASVMDGLRVSYFRPETDVEKHLDLQLKLWNMPPKTTNGAGYWPGLGPIIINGQLCCSTCKQLLTDVVDSGPSDKESAKHIKVSVISQSILRLS
jgi:hypothetical protein